ESIALQHDYSHDRRMSMRYVLVEFDDDATADAFRAKIDSATKSRKKYRVVGLFARPKRYCRCATSRSNYVERTTKTAKALKGGKFGWWVCPECKRSRFGDQHPNNLIPREDLL